MNRLTLVMLVDAFRRDYVDRTRYIRALTTSSRTGALREDLGFLPRASYFGGLGPAEVGFTNMYCCDPESSPFGLARGLPRTVGGRHTDDRFGVRAWIDAEARQRVPEFAASYLSSAAIPLDLLPWFDVVEQRAPWDRAVGYESVFHKLADRGDSYFTCAWPDTNTLSDGSDTGIVAHTLAHVQPPCRLAYVHLQELDSVGHAYGPESDELIAALGRTDALVSHLVTTLETRFDQLDLILFGDHGMVSVTGTMDIWSAIEATGLDIGRDVVFFLDSTMARFWFPTSVGRSAIVSALSPFPGRVLDDRDLRRLGLDRADPRNGELIFVADPGQLIAPNFFQRRGEHPRGMHGYEPDCPDNHGFILIRDGDTPRSGQVGVVDPTIVHSELGRLLELSTPELSMHARGVSKRLSGTFTQHADPAAHALVRDHMARVVAETRAIVPDADAIVLTGSFGRDEGGITEDDHGRLVPVNDYDILVVGGGADPQSLAALHERGCALARAFGLDFVHFSYWPTIDACRAPTLANYDVRYGSRVLSGPPDIVDALPHVASAGIPLFEGVQLIWNRLAGLLTALRWPSARMDLHATERRYLVNQTMKARMAIGDWHLLKHRAYDASYETRFERFSWLSSGLGCPVEEQAAVRGGYLYKLHPERVRVVDIWKAARDTSRWLVRTAIDATADVTRRRITTVREAADAYLDMTRADNARIAEDNAYARRMLAGDARVAVQDPPKGSVRQAIYSSLPLVAAALDGDEEAFRSAGARLDDCLTPAWPSTLTAESWEDMRGRVTHAWLKLVH